MSDIDAADHRLNVPFPGARWGHLRLPRPLSDEDWEHLMAVLAAMRPGLVVSPDPQATPEEVR